MTVLNTPLDKSTNKNSSFHIKNVYFLYAFLIILSILCILPVIMAIVNATRSDVDINLNPFSLMPGGHIGDNHKILMDTGKNVWQALLNSIEIAVPKTILSAYFCTLAGFAFAKLQFPFKTTLYVAMLATLMLPTQLGFIGFFDLMSKANLVDSYFPLIITGLHNAAFVFFTKQYIETSVNNELLEASRMDGANIITTFHKIVVPLSMPAVAVMSIFSFVGAWNDLLTPTIMLSSPEKFPLPVFIAGLKDPQIGIHFGAIYLALTISIVPLILVFLVLSRYIIDGVNSGGVKG